MSASHWTGDEWRWQLTTPRPAASPAASTRAWIHDDDAAEAKRRERTRRPFGFARVLEPDVPFTARTFPG